MDENLFPHIEKIEQRLDRIEKKLKKQVEERKMDLKEKFRLHDRAQTLLRQFTERGDWFKDEPEFKKLEEIVQDLTRLVDVALGVRFP